MNGYTKILFTAFLFFAVFYSCSVSAQESSNHKINSIEYISNTDVLIYPNPVTNNKFFVKSEKIIKSVEVMNILGQNIKTVYNDTEVAYNLVVKLNDIKKGMYMVRVTFDKNQSIIHKIILK